MTAQSKRHHNSIATSPHHRVKTTTEAKISRNSTNINIANNKPKTTTHHHTTPNVAATTTPTQNRRSHHSPSHLFSGRIHRQDSERVQQNTFTTFANTRNGNTCEPKTTTYPTLPPTALKHHHHVTSPLHRIRTTTGDKTPVAPPHRNANPKQDRNETHDPPHKEPEQ
jgi:hypothetical protein